MRYYMSKEIPIVTCFNNNYVSPAGVCFYSLLENADSDYKYKIYVLHNEITDENKQKLIYTIRNFKNGSIEFIDMNNKFEDLCLRIFPIFTVTHRKVNYEKISYPCTRRGNAVYRPAGGICRGYVKDACARHILRAEGQRRNRIYREYAGNHDGQRAAHKLQQ